MIWSAILKFRTVSLYLQNPGTTMNSQKISGTVE